MCKLWDVQKMKNNYYRSWDHSTEHITSLGVRLTREQAELKRQGITISDADKL